MQKRIPEGYIIGDIQLEACKAYPIRIFSDIDMKPRIAYSDMKNGENSRLYLKLLPKGAKTAPHPQLCFFVKGEYHIEELTYLVSNAFSWSTWIEFAINVKQINQLISALSQVKTNF